MHAYNIYGLGKYTSLHAPSNCFNFSIAISSENVYIQNCKIRSQVIYVRHSFVHVPSGRMVSLCGRCSMEDGPPTLPWTHCPSSGCWGRGRDSRYLSTQPVPPRCECTLWFEFILISVCVFVYYSSCILSTIFKLPRACDYLDRFGRLQSSIYRRYI